MMRRLNLVFLAVLLAVVAVFGGGMHLVHGVQIQRNASALLDRARRAEAGKDLEKAEQSLSQYLNIRREDGPAWEWYARVVDQRDSDHRPRSGSSWSTRKPSGITPATRSSSAGAPTSPWSWNGTATPSAT